MSPEHVHQLDACPHCGYVPSLLADAQRHAAGLDRHHLECSHQDIEVLKAAQTPRTNLGLVKW